MNMMKLEQIYKRGAWILLLLSIAILFNQCKEPASLSAVIVTDADEQVSNDLETILENNYIIEIASNGKQGLEKALKIIPDIILTDVMMPEVSGIDVYREVTARRPELASRFVFMTGGAFGGATADALEGGAPQGEQAPEGLRHGAAGHEYGGVQGAHLGAVEIRALGAQLDPGLDDLVGRGWRLVFGVAQRLQHHEQRVVVAFELIVG